MSTSVIKISVLILAFFSPGLATSGEINTGKSGNLAIKGYDPVAYFTEQRAVKGSENFSHCWLGAEWNFSSAQHRQLFSENPVKYAPQYGGHCADGIAYGAVVTDIDPQAWRIIDDKLYLNADADSATELVELEGQLAKAKKNWHGIRARLISRSD